MTKYTANELIELALIYAVQDREAMVDATRSDDPEHAAAKDLAKQFRAYHKRRFRKAHLNALEAALAKAVPVTLDELRRRAEGSSHE